jgi:hypothetical protein
MCAHRYSFVDEITMLVIQKNMENRNTVMARVTEINQTIKSIH